MSRSGHFQGTRDQLFALARGADAAGASDAATTTVHRIRRQIDFATVGSAAIAIRIAGVAVAELALTARTRAAAIGHGSADVAAGTTVVGAN